jgi:opacity protein-like surface antigen
MVFSYRNAMRLMTGALLLLLPFCPSAAAGDGNLVEISLVAGYQFGGSFDIELDGTNVQPIDFDDAPNYGVFLDFRLQEQATFGGMFMRTETELDSNALVGSAQVGVDLDFYHLQGSYEFNDRDYTGYVVASLGVTRFDADGFDHDTRFSFTVGGGFRWFPVSHFGLRFEVRYYGTLVNRDSEGICATINNQAVCLVYSDSTLLSQWDGKAGLVFAF